MRTHRVSIAMATYNGEHYIEKQLNTLLEQTRKPDEVVICDDLSTDKTVEIVKRFIDKHNLPTWHLNVNDKNVGYKENFYNAIKRTTGDIIFLADQDDEWCSNKLERMLREFDSYPDVLSLSCAVQLIDGESKNIECVCQPNYYNCDFLYLDHTPSIIERFDLPYIAKHNISPGCTTAITRSLAETFLKTYNFELPHDWFINLLAAVKDGCAFLNEPLIRYRRHNNNTIGANNGAVSGIKKKTRAVRIEDYSFRIRAIQTVIDSMGACNGENNELDDIITLYRRMVDFYESPNIAKLMRIRKSPHYNELAKRKVHIWEVLVALRFDTAVTRLIG